MAKETNFPEIIDTRGFRVGIDEGFDKAIFEWGIGDKLETLSLPLLHRIEGLEFSLVSLPWWLIFSVIVLLTYSATKKWTTEHLFKILGITTISSMVSIVGVGAIFIVVAPIVFSMVFIINVIAKLVEYLISIEAPFLFWVDVTTLNGLMTMVIDVMGLVFIVVLTILLLFKVFSGIKIKERVSNTEKKSLLKVLDILTKNWMPTVLAAVMIFLCGVVGLWEFSMQTIALMVTATVMAIIIGVPLGIAMSRFNWVQRSMLPVLDLMQTLPIFVYLIPFVMVFGPGKVPALLATLVFALPPVIRLTDLGIRHVDAEIIEAVTAFGSTPRQKLFTAQLPLALPTIMAGINQTTMLALSMVVIASMIGAGGLGFQVLQGINRLEIGRGLLSGIAIVFLAIVFDRIAQSYGKKMQQHLYHTND